MIDRSLALHLTKPPPAPPVRKTRPGKRWRRRLMILGAIWGGVVLAETVADRVDPFPWHRMGDYPESRRVVGADGSWLRVEPTPAGERRIQVPLEEFPSHLIAALLVSEDRNFRSHSGVNWWSVVRAAGSNIFRGRVVSGASTIPMQLSRILEPRGRSLWGKFLEMRRARQLVRHKNRAEILEAYLNLAPFDANVRGFPAAAWRWFGKEVSDVTVAESAQLVAMLPAPSRRRGDRDPEGVLAHRDRVLRNMAEAGFLSDERLRSAMSTPVARRPHPFPYRYPQVTQDVLTREAGVVVRTTLDLDWQERVGAWVGESGSDSVSGVAVVVLDRRTGEPRVMVGTRDFAESQVDATRARRSAGSTLKPFLYALAWELGVGGPDRPVDDTPVRYADYAPNNFDHQWRGGVSASEALRTSRNTPAVRLLQVVTPTRFRHLLSELGFDAARNVSHLDGALGTLAITPRELAEAWRRFADEGRESSVRWALRQRTLEELAQASPDPTQVRSQRVAWKTGTSSGRRDAWCAGVTEDFAIAVWLGDLTGEGDPDLVGFGPAAQLFARVVASAGASR